jgi:Mg2+ and Co2+ transporter CorA
MERIPAHYLELVSDSLLKVYWYKKSLRNALRRSGVSENFLSTWSEDETKRDMLERLFPKLEGLEKGILVVNRLADTLLEQKTFPDLERLEDSRLRIKQAKDSIEALRNYRQRQAETTQSERDRAQTQQRARDLQQEVLKRRHQVDTLADRLNSLSTEFVPVQLEMEKAFSQ